MIHRYSPATLRTLRQRSRLSARDVARASGVATNTLMRLEHGRARPQTRTLNRLLALYADRIRALDAQHATLFPHRKRRTEWKPRS